MERNTRRLAERPVSRQTPWDARHIYLGVTHGGLHPIECCVGDYPVGCSFSLFRWQLRTGWHHRLLWIV